MRKIILSVAMLATVAFLGCSSDDDGEPKCKTCDDLPFFDGVTVEFCDNGDNTVTITSSFLGFEGDDQTIDIPEGASFEDYDCSNIEELIGDGFSAK